MSVTFDAVIRSAQRGGAWVEVPDDVVAELGGGGRIKVQASIDGQPYRGSIVSMGGRKRLGVVKAIRETVGKGPGDSVHVAVAVDTRERVVEVPPELTRELRAHPDARRLFDGLSYTHRKEYARWVAEAKKQETRDRRAAKAITMLDAGKTL